MNGRGNQLGGRLAAYKGTKETVMDILLLYNFNENLKKMQKIKMM